MLYDFFCCFLIQNSPSTTSLCVLIRNYELQHFKLRCHICIFHFLLPVLLCQFLYFLQLLFPHSFQIICVFFFCFFHLFFFNQFFSLVLSDFRLSSAWEFLSFFVSILLPASVKFFFSDLYLLFSSFLSISFGCFRHNVSIARHSGGSSGVCCTKQADGNANVTLILSSDIYYLNCFPPANAGTGFVTIISSFWYHPYSSQDKLIQKAKLKPRKNESRFTKYLIFQAVDSGILKSSQILRTVSLPQFFLKTFHHKPSRKCHM